MANEKHSIKQTLLKKREELKAEVSNLTSNKEDLQKEIKRLMERCVTERDFSMGDKPMSLKRKAEGVEVTIKEKRERITVLDSDINEN